MDIGGSFFTKKTMFENRTPFLGTVYSDVKYYGSPTYNYSGTITAPLPVFGKPENQGILSTDLSDMIGKGSTAISRVLPTNPVGDASVFLGELREGLPSVIGKDLFKSRFLDPRKLGDEYLNVEFGIKPLISDLQKFATAATQSDKIVQQLRRDSGKRVRRSYSFPDIVSVTETVSADPPVGGNNTYLYAGTWATSRTTTVTTSYKFDGAFTYHMDLGDSLHSRIARIATEARLLYGADLSASTLWNLSPWSWMVDWGINMGDVLSNMSAFSKDGLVMPYGYIQKHVVSETITRTYGGRYLNGGAPRLFEHKSGFETKMRIKATPFGFGFNMSGATPRQLAIIAALGLSRSPKLPKR